jgi:nucleoside 2-deoxyribosyltransferase
MTGKNPNVFYEVGYAHAKGKLTILLTSDAADIPFDLKHRRHIVYESIIVLRERLKEELQWAKTEVENTRIVALKFKHELPEGN